MFTGIVEGVGIVKSLQERKESWLLGLDLPFGVEETLKAGESLAVNGCCHHAGGRIIGWDAGFIRGNFKSYKSW